MMTTLSHAIMYTASFGAILIMFATAIGLVWLFITTFRALTRPLR
jgi:hypothetical protein